MRQQRKKQNISGLLVLVVFAVFVVSILSVLFTGADVYQRLAQRDQSSYDRRTAVQYITTRIHQSDAQDALFTAPFALSTPQTAGDTLFLTEDFDGEFYCTRIYCYDGYIRELFTEMEGEFYPEDGEPILPAESLQFHISGNLLTAEIDYAQGSGEQFVLCLRSGEVAP